MIKFLKNNMTIDSDWDENQRIAKEQQYQKWHKIALRNFIKPTMKLFRVLPQPPYIERTHQPPLVALLGHLDASDSLNDFGKYRVAINLFNQKIWGELKSYLELFETEFKQLEDYAGSVKNEKFSMEGLVDSVTRMLAKTYNCECPIENARRIQTELKLHEREILTRAQRKKYELKREYDKLRRKESLAALIEEAKYAYG